MVNKRAVLSLSPSQISSSEGTEMIFVFDVKSPRVASLELNSEADVFCNIHIRGKNLG